MRTSISTTSGRSSAASATASAPSPASPTTSTPLVSRITRSPAAHEVLVVGDERRARVMRGSRASTANPPLGPGRRRQRAAERGDPLAHPDEAVARRRVPPAGPGAVVEDLDGDGVGAVGDGDLGVAGAGVAQHVGQRLLHDAVGRRVDGVADRPRRAGDRAA